MSENEIGKKILARRKALGLTLEDVGNAVGVGKSTVRKWESGMIKNMGSDKIVALARVLGMNPVEFVPGSNTIHKAPQIKLKHNIKSFGNAYVRAVVNNPRKDNQVVAVRVISKKNDPEFDSLVKAWNVATPKAKEEAVRFLEFLNTTNRMEGKK